MCGSQHIEAKAESGCSSPGAVLSKRPGDKFPVYVAAGKSFGRLPHARNTGSTGTRGTVYKIFATLFFVDAKTFDLCALKDFFVKLGFAETVLYELALVVLTELFVFSERKQQVRFNPAAGMFLAICLCRVPAGLGRNTRMTETKKRV